VISYPLAFGPMTVPPGGPLWARVVSGGYLIATVAAVALTRPWQAGPPRAARPVDA
jgi:hypothetical protein